MSLKTSIGKQDFARVIEEGCFYVDKTHMIREWWEYGDDVTLITRPRRFGKTLTLSMLEAFFSLEYAGRDLFKGLEIWNDGKYRALQGTFPVISLSFANVKADQYSLTKAQIFQCLFDCYNKNIFLLDSEALTNADKDYFTEILSQREKMNDLTAVSSLNRLCQMMYAHYGKRPILLLDEYDTPMQEACVSGYWDEIVSLFRSLFNSTFKTNPSLYRAVLTGITRVSRESIFSDLNNLEIVTTTSEKYADCFGFTEGEVFAALDMQGLSDKKEDVRRWYDGFTFGSVTDIYNPWSIINYLQKRRFDTYWANTSSNGLAAKLIREGSPEVKMAMETLLNGMALTAKIDEQIIFDQLQRKRGAIWSLLLAAGYLKVLGHDCDANGRNEYTLALTNFETKLMFDSMIEEWFTAEGSGYNEFIHALLADDLEEMNAYMNRVAAEVFSYFDTGKSPSEQRPERFYHGFVLGLLVDLRQTYRIRSNRESGFGRYDIMLQPLQESDDAMVIEFKVFDPNKEKTLADTLASALSQIERREYDSELLNDGIPAERIRHYGFAFQGKQVLIGK